MSSAGELQVVATALAQSAWSRSKAHRRQAGRALHPAPTQPRHRPGSAPVSKRLSGDPTAGADTDAMLDTCRAAHSISTAGFALLWHLCTCAASGCGCECRLPGAQPDDCARQVTRMPASRQPSAKASLGGLEVADMQQATRANATTLVPPMPQGEAGDHTIMLYDNMATIR